jgi:GNAT superfamily N-acetyltransferase
VAFIDLGPSGACLRSDAVRLYGQHEVRCAIRTGTLHTPWPRVLTDATRAAEPLTLITAAWLAVGRDALVTGPSAAFLHGLTALPPTPVHLIVPYHSRQRGRPGIVVHNGGGLVEDRDERRGVPVLCLERLVSDLACTASPPDALAVIDQALASLKEEDRPSFRRHLGERLQARPDPRGTRIGRRLVDLATGLAESPAESWWLWRVVDLGFPVPDVNPWIRDLDGVGLFRLDLGWLELRIALEHNGYAAHREREDHDARRLADLERRGWLAVVVEADDLRSVCRMEAELHEAFRRRGVDLRGRVAGSLRPLPHRGPRP